MDRNVGWNFYDNISLSVKLKLGHVAIMSHSENLQLFLKIFATLLLISRQAIHICRSIVDLYFHAGFRFVGFGQFNLLPPTLEVKQFWGGNIPTPQRFIEMEDIERQ